MFKTSKIDCTIEPKKFESLNNGVWYYNFDVESEVISEPIMGDEENSREIIRYKYAQVRILGEPTLTKCYEAMLRSYLNEEGTSLMSVMSSPAKTEEAEQLAESLYETAEIDFGKKVKPTELEMEKRKAIKAIDDYDVSMEVNSFFLNGLQVWLDKSTRVGLMNSLNIEKLAGKETSTLWFGNIKLDINTGAAIQMLSSLELYALECYNKTAEHKVNIENMTSVEDVINYDFTEGYPDKLNLSV